MMSAAASRRMAVLVRFDLHQLRADPLPYVMTLVTPLALMWPLTTIYRHLSLGSAGRTGPAAAVVGLAVTYVFFLVGQTGVAVFREHGWNTWPRLRASPLTATEIVLARSVVEFMLGIVHLVLLLTLGSILYGLPFPGSPFGVALLLAALSASMVAFGLALVAAVRTIMALSTFANLAALLFGGLGGGLFPVALLPTWARDLAHVTPTFWAVQGLRHTMSPGGQVTAALAPVGILVLMTALCGAFAVWRFDAADAKVTWA